MIQWWWMRQIGWGLTCDKQFARNLFMHQSQYPLSRMRFIIGDLWHETSSYQIQAEFPWRIRHVVGYFSLLYSSVASDLDSLTGGLWYLVWIFVLVGRQGAFVPIRYFVLLTHNTAHSIPYHGMHTCLPGWRKHMTRLFIFMLYCVYFTLRILEVCGFPLTGLGT